MIKLNLGSGWHPLKGYKNVDLYYPADIKADLRTVEFPEASIAEIVTSHTIEHFVREEGSRLVERCFRWLQSGGRLTIEWPDQDKCRELLASESERFRYQGAKGLQGGRSIDKDGWREWLREWTLRGANMSEPIPEKWNLPGEQHLYVWGGKELAKEFQRVGFKEVQLSLPMFHGRQGNRDSQVSGVKP